MTDMCAAIRGDRDEALVAYLYDDADGDPLGASARVRGASRDVRALPRRARGARAACAAARAAGRRPSRRFDIVDSGSRSPSAPIRSRRRRPTRPHPIVVARHAGLGAGCGGAAVPRRVGRHREPRRAVRPERPERPHRLVEAAGARPRRVRCGRRAVRRLDRGRRRGAPISPRSSASCRPRSAPRRRRTGAAGRRAAQPAPSTRRRRGLRRVRALVDESEKRQQRELALRVAEADARRATRSGRPISSRSIARSAWCRTTSASRS